MESSAAKEENGETGKAPFKARKVRGVLLQHEPTSLRSQSASPSLQPTRLTDHGRVAEVVWSSAIGGSGLLRPRPCTVLVFRAVAIGIDIEVS